MSDDDESYGRLDVSALLRSIPRGAESGELTPPKCGAQPWMPGRLLPGALYCDGEFHHCQSGVVGRCPIARAREIQSRLEQEMTQRAGELNQASTSGPVDFEGYDTDHSLSGAMALAAMFEFARGTRGAGNVLLMGPTGLGKTRLLLASHLFRLKAGLPSLYLTTDELRLLVQASESFDAEVAQEARDELARYAAAPFVHLDQLGADGEPQRRGAALSDALYRLLGKRRGKWAVAVSLDMAHAAQHPDIGNRVLFSLVHGSTLVAMDGEDYRLRAATQKGAPRLLTLPPRRN